MIYVKNNYWIHFCILLHQWRLIWCIVFLIMGLKIHKPFLIYLWNVRYAILRGGSKVRQIRQLPKVNFEDNHSLSYDLRCKRVVLDFFTGKWGYGT